MTEAIMRTTADAAKHVNNDILPVSFDITAPARASVVAGMCVRLLVSFDVISTLELSCAHMLVVIRILNALPIPLTPVQTLSYSAALSRLPSRQFAVFLYFHFSLRCPFLSSLSFPSF
jgi:hypothetical protein